jgi:hypothetical protein
MHTQFISQIRAHAHALVRIARAQLDSSLALELENIALELLKTAHDFESKMNH